MNKEFVKHVGFTCTQSDCEMKTMDRGAFLCVKCTPQGIITKDDSGLRIDDFEKAEEHVQCGSCILLFHKNHEYMEYLPAKLRKGTAKYNMLIGKLGVELKDNSDNLLGQVSKEHKDLHEPLKELSVKSQSLENWNEFVDRYTKADEIIKKIANLNANLKPVLQEHANKVKALRDQLAGIAGGPQQECIAVNRQ